MNRLVNINTLLTYSVSVTEYMDDLKQGIDAYTSHVYVNMQDVINYLEHHFRSTQGDNGRLYIYSHIAVENILVALLSGIETSPNELYQLLSYEESHNPDAINYFNKLSLTMLDNLLTTVMYKLEQQLDSLDDIIVIGGWVNKYIISIYIHK